MMEDKDSISILARKISVAYDEAHEATREISLRDENWYNAFSALDTLHKFIRSMPSLQKTTELDTYLGYYKNIVRKIKAPELVSLLPDHPWEYAKELYKIYREWKGYMIEIIQKSGIWEKQEEETIIDKVNFTFPNAKVKK